MFEEYGKDSSGEAVIKIVGKLGLEFPDLKNDLQKQIKIRNIVEEILYNYTVTTKETSLVATDTEDKIKIYLDTKKLEGTKDSTIKLYRYNLLKFSNCLRMPLSTVKTGDLRMYLAVRCKNLKQTSTNGQITTLKTFFQWLQNEEYIPKNPALKLKQVKQSKRLRHALSDEEVELLRQACKTDRQKALVEFLVSTGCRLSEVVQVNIDKIDWHEMSLFVIGKGDKERKVYFSVKAKILIQNYLKTRKGNSNALFISSKYPYNRLHGRAIEKEIKKIALTAGFDKSIYPHIFRHSFGTHNINAGMPLSILQQLMGHSSPQTTLIYSEISQDNIKHEYKKIH